MSLEAEAHVALRDALRGIELPAIDADAMAESVAGANSDAARLLQHVARAAGANDLDGAMAGAVAVILAAEGAAKALSAIMDRIGQHRSAAVQAAAQARAALAKAMADTGCPAVLTATHRADPLEGSERVEVTDPARLPLSLWKQPDPEPDKAAIRKALKKGPVPGAALVRGAPSVRISIRQEQVR